MAEDMKVMQEEQQDEAVQTVKSWQWRRDCGSC